MRTMRTDDLADRGSRTKLSTHLVAVRTYQSSYLSAVTDLANVYSVAFRVHRLEYKLGLTNNVVTHCIFVLDHNTLLFESLTSLVREHTKSTLVLGVIFVELGIEFLHPVSPKDLTCDFDWFIVHLNFLTLQNSS